MSNLLDLTDLLDDPALAEKTRADLARRGHKLKKKTGVVAKLHKPEPFKPRGIYTGQKKDRRQQLIWDRFTCVCSHTWVAPRYNSETFDRLVDNPFNCHYESATHTLANRTSIEYHDRSVSVCPNCFSSEHTCSDPTLRRMFDLPDPDQDSLSLDFDNWAYSPFPIVPVGQPTTIKGLTYVRHQRHLAAIASYPKCSAVADRLARLVSHACPASAIGSQRQHLVYG